jgi:hypothetical protein
MFKKTLLVHALTLAFGGAALTVGLVAPAMAQSNATGNIHGRVDAPAGASVTLTNTDTGLKRTITPDANGNYRATAMPQGHYRVELIRNGQVADTTEVDVIIGQGVNASFLAAGVQQVKVTARRTLIDVSNTNNGAVFTAKELQALPIARDVNSIIQLAPNTTRADSRYAGGASFGGGGASENAYYINGMIVTNALTQLGASELPFGAISQAQVLTGGYGAEFGRSVGGVVNITTKSGTNNWEVGGMLSYEPSSWRQTEKSGYYAMTGAKGNEKTDGKILFNREHNERARKMAGLYVGGPLIQDKLFMFVAAEQTRTDREYAILASSSTSAGSTGWNDEKSKTDRYLGKFDWNITDAHRLELTLIGDTPKTTRRLSGFNHDTGARDGVVRSVQHYSNIATVDGGNGGKAQVLRYTGNLTDNLTIQALYGVNKSKHINTFEGYDLNQKLYQVTAPLNARAPGITYNTPQVLTGNIISPGAEDKTTSRRLDLEYKLGDHTLRAGVDDNKLSSLNAGVFRAGGGTYTYRVITPPTTPNDPISIGGTKVAVASGGGLGTQGYYASETLYNTVTNAYSDQSAQYIEDRWQVTKDVLLTLGLRNEQFTNKNGDNVAFLEMKDQIAPRVSAAWDVYGDASLKVYGSAGRYHVQIPTHLAVRGASRSLFTTQYFTYTGVDANGAPIGRVDITPAHSSNNEYYQAKDVKTLAAIDMKPTYQDEITLGFERAWSADLNFGVRGTYRTLKTTIDDFCDPRPFDRYAERNKINTDNWGGFGCATFNPGEDNSFWVDFAGTGTNHTRVDFTAEELGFPKAKRIYKAIDMFVEHPMRNGWYGRVNYTWSKSEGNTEGQTLSDVAQTDVAATQTWDHPELMYHAYGLLPNHREHQLKAFGVYEITPEFSIGGNALVATGRPVNCIGNDPSVDDHISYGSAYRMCDGKPVPRGTAGKLPTDVRLDLNLAYKPAMLKGLMLKVDVFNVANRQVAQTVDEVYNTNAAVSPTYGRVISYTPPRYVRLSAEYNYKF